MKKLATFLSVIAMAAVAPLARADFNISINTTSCASGVGNPAVAGGEGGACAFQFFVGGNPNLIVKNLSSSGTQTATNSQQFTTTLEIDNNTAAAFTFTLDAAMNDFTLPKTPPSVTDAFGYTLDATKGTVTTSSYKACVDQGNGLTAPTGTCASPTPIVNLVGPNVTASSEGNQLIASLSPSFSLNQEIVITLAAGSSVDVTASQTLTQVPEPAAILLFGTMLVGVTSIARRRAAKRS